MTERQGIPTYVNGRLMRSLLESRWARFFELAQWKYEYEPFELPGWIPDFALIGAKETVLVEVKPIFALDHDVVAKLETAAAAGGWTGDILLLGAGLSIDTYARIGWLGEFQPEVSGGWDWGGAICGDNYSYTLDQVPHHVVTPKQALAHEHGHFRDRISGDYAGGTLPENVRVEELWTAAGNEVMWNRPR